MAYIPDSLDAFNAHDARQAKQMQTLPKCDECGDCITDSYYEFDALCICSDCMERNHKQYID